MRFEVLSGKQNGGLKPQLVALCEKVSQGQDVGPWPATIIMPLNQVEAKP